MKHEEKAEKIKNMLWHLDGKHTVSLSKTEENISHTTQEILKLLSTNGDMDRRELLLAAICEYNKYNTQKDIKAVDEWLDKWDNN